MRFPLPAREPSTSARWDTDAFAREVRDWAEAALGGPVRLERHKQRPWATVWRVHAADGLYYAKQNCPQQAHEPALVQCLGASVPEHVLAPVAVDADRGFLLLPDGGPVLGEHAGTDVEVWCRVVAQWGEVQRGLLEGEAALPALPVFAPLDAPQFLADRVDALASLPPDDPRAMAPDVAGRLHGRLPEVARWAEQVAALDLPLTLNHNDLHAWNVFVPEHRGELRFFDLGDAVVSEPLAALHIALEMFGPDLGPDERACARERMCEAFLEVWSDVATTADLRAALPAALELTRLMRHESWVRVQAAMDDAELAEHGAGPRLCLERLLDADPLGERPPAE